MRIKFGDLKIGEIAKNRLQKAIDQNWASEGENVKEFEERFAKQFDYKHAVAVSSGTDGCMVACASLYEYGAKRGDEIIAPALSFVATSNAILAAGFIPKFVDVCIDTLNIDINQIEKAITNKTRAIMVVHTMGKPCDMDVIKQIANKYNLKIIEDACESHGAKYKSQYIGTIGDMGVFSFYTAHLVVSGEGGMVVTNDDQLVKIISSVKSHGRPFGSIYFDFQRFGFNSKMNDLTAAIGIEGIIQFEKTFEIRKKNMYRLLNLTEELRDYLYFSDEKEYEIICPHAFPILLKDPKYGRDKLYRFLESSGIQCKTLFGCLPTQHKAFEFMNIKIGDFPNAEYIGNNGLHFGIHQYLIDDDLMFISKTLKKYFDKAD